MSKPILYKANETDFTTLGLGVLVDELGTFATEERNGQFYLEMEYPIDGKHFNELKNDRLIKVDASNNLKNQRFKIIRITKPAKGKVKVYAEHVSNLSADKQINPNVSYSGNAQSALNTWGNNITDTHPFTFHSDITTTGSGRWEVDEVENARRALGGVQGSILDTYGGEYRFDNYHISLLKQRGDDNGIPIMYGKNLIDLEQEEEIASTYTSIYPYALHHPEGADESEVITLPELVIDSEHVDKYAHRKILKVNFTADEIETVAELRTRTQRYITENNVGIPKINLRVKFVDLAKTLDYKDTALVEEINLCDWVTVYFDKLGILQRAKVIKTVWNVGLDRYEEIEIGETRASLSQSINSVVDGRLEHVEEQVNVIRISANGKNKNHWGPNEPLPQDSKEGDTWFKPIGDGEEEIYRYNGYMWVFVLSTADTTLNKEAIEQAQLDIEQAQATADNAITEISTAIDAAGFDTLADSLTGIQSISQTAQNNSIEALGTAQDSMNTAMSALNSATEAITEIENIDIRVDEVEGSLSIKADKQVVDALAGVVDTHTTDIQANAQGLALKANQSTVDTLAGTVQSLGTEFDAVAGKVNSRVWMADIDDIEIGGRNYFSPSKVNSTAILGSVNSGTVIGSSNYKSFYISVKKDEVWSLSRIEIGNANRFGYTFSEEEPLLGVEVGGGVDHRNDLKVEGIKIPFDGWMYIYLANNVREVDSLPNIQLEKGNKATDWTPAPEDTDAKFDYIETEWTQTFDTFSQHVSSIDGRVTAQKQTIDSITSTVADNTGRISTTEQTIDGLQDTVYDPETGLTSVNTQLANLVNIAVTGDELSGALSVLEDNLNLRLVAKDEVIAQINLSNENILIQSNRILLDGDVTVSGTAWLPGAVIADASIDTAQIADLAVSSAKIVSLDVSKLSGNHMEFITGAFTASNGDISITGRQIQINSIDYANMRLNRNNVEFSRGDGIIVGGLVATHNPYVSGSNLGLTLLSARSGQVAGIGRHLGSGSHTPSISVSGTSGNIEVHNNMTMDTNVPFYFRSGGYVVTDSNNMIIRNTNDTSAFHIDVGAVGSINNTIASFNRSGIQHYRNMSMNNNNILAINTIDSLNRMTNVGSIEALWYRGPRNEQVYFGVNRDGSSVTSFRLQHDGMRMYQSVNWNGNNLHAVGSINYASDARLKEIIGNRTEDDLATIMAINYKNYYRSGSKERGFIAQELQLIDSDLITVGENGMLGYDGQGYVHTIGHAVQQLALKELNTNLLASENRTLIEELQQENKKLRNRLEELESAA